MGGVLWSGVSGSSAPPPAVAPTWHPVEATPVPQSAVPESDVVIPASAPVRLEIPSVDFDSSKLGGKTSNPIQQWTEAMNNAANGEVTPPDPWDSSLVWDSTVAGGGLFGTDAQSSGRILGHTTPWSWSKLGSFQSLVDVHVGDPVAITTQKGRLCYTVAKSDSVRKSQLNVVYDKEAVTPGVVYLITCDRARDYGNGATVNNLVVALQFNQQQTNTGSC
jgi:hypothetical protein